MCSLKKYSLLIILLLLHSFSPAAFASSHINNIIFFGDSLSDNGNLYKFTLHYAPKSPPYFEGRFSNGLVWADLVAEHYKTTRKITSENFAVGGEVISLHGIGYVPWSFYESVDNYFFHHPDDGSRASTLYIIWVGGNDYLDGAENENQYTDTAIQNLDFSIQRLIDRGAKNFILINLPDLSKTPYSRLRGNTKNVAELTAMHNAKLDLLVEKLRKNKNVKAELYRANKLFDELTKDTTAANKKYNLALHETKKTCWPGDYRLRQTLLDNDDMSKLSKEQISLIKHAPDVQEAYVTAKKFNQGLKACQNPENYLFWDKVHPTQVIHAVLAKQMIQFIDQYFI